MRFDITDEQRSIKQAVRDLAASRCDLATVRRIAEGGDGGELLWRELARAGWTGVCVSEEYAGQGLGVLELALVVEELGYALAPAHFLGNAIAGLLIAGAGNEQQRRRWLPGIASGEHRAALGVLLDDGTALVLDPAAASWILVVGASTAAVADPAGARFDGAQPVDITRRLARVSVTDAEPLGGDVAAALDRAEVALSAELVGVAQHAMEMALAYARQRQQFGRPIGAYQAVSHRCADMFLLVESARSAVLGAGWTADHDPGALPLAASVAKASAADAAWRVTTGSLQVHGGIGFTWDHDIHLFIRRAAASARLLGGADAHLDRAAALAGLGA